ncbi:hypothetical protein [Mesoterricola silvestris]|uniref:hypothetical protein n=1 Tax=Mesoterricola silvestris TaxID=2927979 RepID=UPI00292F7889|nr:hypothetical protein [Mesoterricola silvestris]
MAYPPPFRRLRGYAFDPSLSLHLETASINHAVFEIPWEVGLEPGPTGEYVRVLDVDAASQCWYEPVDLNELEIAAQNGLPPSEGNPQFHQQMVYAAAVNTICNFEQALGRPVFWAPLYDDTRPPGKKEVFIQHLRLYPHAIRAANAYYSPAKRAILFGYFPGPSGMVFSCLSSDIIAHETTHALLDGLHRRYLEDTNEDVLAFHEGFADLVALFQHFTFPEVLRHQIRKTRGDLALPSLLGELAREFGEATGGYGALRSAIGTWDEKGAWRPIEPDPERLRTVQEPHDRGAVLVAAVFGAFLAVNKARCEDLLRLATGGTGVLPAGAIGGDLVDRLAVETNKTAGTFLTVCIRALDYTPWTDLTFGDYLRALITADHDMVPDDRIGLRVALIESFRRWGIVPAGLKVLSEEQLRWPYAAQDLDPRERKVLTKAASALRSRITETLFLQDREALFEKLREARRFTHEYLRSALAADADPVTRSAFERTTGLSLDPGLPGIFLNERQEVAFEVHALYPALRVSPSGTTLKQLVVTVAQRRRLPVDPEDPDRGTFDFRGGATLIFDLEGKEPRLRYTIPRPIDSGERLAAIRAYFRRRGLEGVGLRATYFGAPPPGGMDLEDECFGLLHGER